jgi:hypothetical protein
MNLKGKEILLVKCYRTEEGKEESVQLSVSAWNRNKLSFWQWKARAFFSSSVK